MEAAPGEEDTNLDDELRHRLIKGNALPDPETTASMGGTPMWSSNTSQRGYNDN